MKGPKLLDFKIGGEVMTLVGKGGDDFGKRKEQVEEIDDIEKGGFWGVNFSS